MAKWLSNGLRVHYVIRDEKKFNRPPTGEVRNGTVVYARGDYSDIEWDDAPGKLYTVHNSELEVTRDGIEPRVEIVDEIAAFRAAKS